MVEHEAQFSSRPSLVPSVTVVLLKFSDRWEGGEGRLEADQFAAVLALNGLGEHT